MADDNTPIPPAQPGDEIAGADLQPTIDALKDRAAKITTDMPLIDNVPDAQAALRLQQDLLSQAGALVNRKIALLAGEARISAEHVNGAVEFANKTIDRIATWKARLQLAAKVLGFVATVATGDGKAIFAAAKQLKSDLDNA